MQEVLLYGITKEPVHCLHGDKYEIYEEVRLSEKMYPCNDGSFIGGDRVDHVVDRKYLPIHTIRLNNKDYWGVRHPIERRITFTPEFIKEVGGNPVEMLEEIQQLQGHSKKLSKELLDVNDTLTLLKLEISTANFWKRLKWVFTGVEV